MNPTNQAFWPSIADAVQTYGQPIGANIMSKPDLRTQFWMDAYLTSLGDAHNTDFAKRVADNAVRQLSIFQHLPYSQNEGGNIPYAPRDEVAGCLRSAITAMECLREMRDVRGVNFFPGLDDLIARSKKALGDA